jgi:hypothetical protein
VSRVGALVETSGLVARWETEARIALAYAGYDLLVDIKGSNDWQGSGAILARGLLGWAVLSWTYGSCSGCDVYESMSTREIVDDMLGAVAHCTDEQMARERFAGEVCW